MEIYDEATLLLETKHDILANQHCSSCIFCGHHLCGIQGGIYCLPGYRHHLTMVHFIMKEEGFLHGKRWLPAFPCGEVQKESYLKNEPHYDISIIGNWDGEQFINRQ